jgi:hypothetical protein
MESLPPCTVRRQWRRLALESSMAISQEGERPITASPCTTKREPARGPLAATRLGMSLP